MLVVQFGVVAILFTRMLLSKALVVLSEAPNVTVCAGTAPCGKGVVVEINPVVKSYLLMVTTGMIWSWESSVGIPVPIL